MLAMVIAAGIASSIGVWVNSLNADDTIGGFVFLIVMIALFPVA